MIPRFLPVYQPVRIKKDPEFIQTLRDMAPDVIVVVAFGQILSKEVLDIPRLGCVNVHASLLPKFRGAAPIQWAIIDGEKVTGVTTMLMDVGLDTGDMLLKTEVSVDAKETGGSLHDKLAAAGGELLERTLIGLEAGTIVPEKQDDSQAGEYARMLDKELGHIDFNQPAVVTDQLWLAAETGYTAVKVAVAIVLGIVFIYELPQGLFVRLAGNK